MELNTYELLTKTKVQFPNTRDVIISLLSGFQSNGFVSDKTLDELVEHCFRKVEVVRDTCENYHQDKIKEIISEAEMSLELSSDSLAYLSVQLAERWKAPNEFFTIFDISLGKEVLIDERLQSLLGLDGDQFHSATIEALEPETTIYLRDDLYHSMRYAMICYMVMTMPGFTWQSQRDHYLARMRFTTKNSKIAAIRALPYVLVEKRCYFSFDNSNGNMRMPQYHFDRYTIYHDIEQDYVFHTLVSEERQSAHMNAFSYLFNLYLLGLSPKYLLLLDERQTNDRNKAVATSLENNIKKKTGNEVHFDEHKIADCFTKSIRPKMEEIFNHWERLKNGNRITISSDAESVHYAKKLGLLPIPKRVKELIYEMISEA